MVGARVRRVRAGPRVSVVVKIDATVVRGEVSEDELVTWVAQAVAEHHRFRGGHVSVSADSAITAPDVEAAEAS